MSTRSDTSFIKRHLAELTNPSQTRGEIVTALKERGYRQLGRGCFAVVLAHPDAPSVVVKVGQINSGKSWIIHLGFKDRFMAYADHLKETGSRYKFALRVYHHAFVSERHGGTYTAIVERCFPGRGCKAQDAITDSANVVKGNSFGTSNANPAATRFLRSIAHLGTLDLHSANIMLRRDGTPVVTDPLC